jgi:hypothetical protein
MTTITGRIAYDSTLSGLEKSEKRIVLVQPLINFVTKSERFWLTNLKIRHYIVYRRYLKYSTYDTN